jgi:hypothetical protein
MCTHKNEPKPFQRSILLFIAAHQAKWGNTPSYEEMAEALEVSKACIADHIRQMGRKGIVKRVLGARRCIIIPAESIPENEEKGLKS